MSDDIFDMAREAGIEFQRNVGVLGRESISTAGSQSIEKIERLVSLVRADERENGQRWFDAVTAQHKAEILAEREACAKVCEDSDHVVHGKGYHDQLGDADATVRNIAAAIRARKNT